MASKEDCDKYAVELYRRYEELTRWAIENWPRKEFPLLASDFDMSRKELSDILGPKLGDGRPSDSPGGNGEDSGQYQDVTPMPWP